MHYSLILQHVLGTSLKLCSSIHFVISITLTLTYRIQHFRIYGRAILTSRGLWTPVKWFFLYSLPNGQTTNQLIVALTVSIDLFFCCGLLPWHPVKRLKTGLQLKPLLGRREQTEPSTSYTTILQKFRISSIFYWFRPFGPLPWSQHQTYKSLGCFRVNHASHKVRYVRAFHVVCAMCVCLW